MRFRVSVEGRVVLHLQGGSEETAMPWTSLRLAIQLKARRVGITAQFLLKYTTNTAIFPGMEGKDLHVLAAPRREENLSHPH